MNNNAGESAWIITWENAGDGESSVALILPGDIEAERVEWLVQELYIANTASDPEKFDSGLRRRVAYPAKKSTTTSGHVRISCGHNPHLRARLVQGIRLQQGEDGVEFLGWTELD